MEQVVVYRVSIEYSTVPTRYDIQLNDSKIDWKDYSDPQRAVREGHSDVLEFLSSGPSEQFSEDGIIDDPAVLKQLRIQICEHLERICPEGYDLDGFTAHLSEDD